MLVVKLNHKLVNHSYSIIQQEEMVSKDFPCIFLNKLNHNLKNVVFYAFI